MNSQPGGPAPDPPQPAAEEHPVADLVSARDDLDDSPGEAPIPAAGQVLRRAIVLWGLGHLLLGDRRGWLLLAIEIAAVIALVALTPPLIDGEASGALFIALVAFIAAWGGQALDTYREAMARGAPRTGAAWILALAAPTIVLVGGFWLVAGRSASPAAAVEQYVTGWRHDRPDVAATALLTAPSAEALRAAWAEDHDALRNRIVALAARLGSEDLDPNRPFDSLHFDIEPGADRSTATVHVSIVRRVLVRTQLLGVFPTASQERRVVEEIGRGVLVAVPGPEGLLPGLRSRVWRLEGLDVSPPPPTVNP